MTLKGNAKFKGKLTSGFKKDKKFGLFLCEQSKVLMSFFSPKHIKFQLKRYRGVMSHDSEE